MGELDGDHRSHAASDAAAAEAAECLIRIAAMCREARHADAPTAALHDAGYALVVGAYGIAGTVYDIDAHARAESPSRRLIRTLLDFTDRASVIAEADPHGEQVSALADDMERLGNALKAEGRAAIPGTTAEQPAATH